MKRNGTIQDERIVAKSSFTKMLSLGKINVNFRLRPKLGVRGGQGVVVNPIMVNINIRTNNKKNLNFFTCEGVRSLEGDRGLRWFGQNTKLTTLGRKRR